MPIYLKYGDKIKGDVKGDHLGWIELGSAQFGVNRDVSREKSAPNISEIAVTKKGDSASQDLLRESISGDPVVAVIDFVKDGTVYLRLTLSGTMISSFTISSGGDRPTESLTLNFTAIKFEQTPGTPPP